MNNEHSSPDELARYWWDKATESLEAARRECNAGSLEFAMNRVYYSAFYAVSAKLIRDGVTFRKHTGVRSAFHKQLIRTGSLPKEWAKFYDRLFTDRQEGDYEPLTEFKEAYVRSQIERCQEFLALMRPLVTS